VFGVATDFAVLGQVQLHLWYSDNAQFATSLVPFNERQFAAADIDYLRR
jgi:hypothetical protein